MKKLRVLLLMSIHILFFLVLSFTISKHSINPGDFDDRGTLIFELGIFIGVWFCIINFSFQRLLLAINKNDRFC